MPEPTVDELTRLAEWVRQNFGMTFPDVRATSLVTKVGQFCGQHKVTVDETIKRCSRGDRVLVQALAEALSTNQASFFRERIVLDYFSSTIIPALPFEGARLWIAACSSGEEVYTLAMLLTQAGRGLTKDSFTILGTDITQRHVRSAEAAVYPATAVTQNCPPGISSQFFLPAGMGMLQVTPQLRARCTFRLLNLRAASWLFERRFHTIFLRNVLPYLDPTETARIGRACVEQLEPGGFLVTSIGDPVLALDAVGVRLVRPGVYRKSGSS